MKKTTFLIVLVSMLMTSCLKDGLNDFDALGHDMSFQGTIHPTLGIPIGSGSATIFDMLQMVQISNASMEINSNNIITVVYDSTQHWDIDMSSKSHKGPGSKTSDIVHVMHNRINGSVDIDLFDNISFLDNAELEVDSILVYCLAYIKAQAREGAMEAMDSFHVQVYYDSLRINVVGQDGSVSNVLHIDDSIPIDSLVSGQYVTLFDNKDISNAVNMRPRELQYAARMNIAFEAAFFATAGISEKEFVADSIGINSISIDANIKVSFPISAYINNLQYQTDIEFAPSFQLGQIVIDSSMINIQCLNSIPLELSLRVQLIDSTDAVLCDILDPVTTIVEAAPVALNPTTNLYTSSGTSNTVIQIPITEFVFNNLLKTKKIRLSTVLNTTDTQDAVRNRVSIQATDKIDLRVWAKVKPSYDLDINLGGDNENDNNGNSQKGGVQ